MRTTVMTQKTTAKRWLRAVCLPPVVLVCGFAAAQNAFQSTTAELDWDEDPSQQATELAELNSAIRAALNQNASDFCYELAVRPKDILNFSNVNCTVGSSKTPNGTTNPDSLAIGTKPFDFDASQPHWLRITAHRQAATPSARTANSLRVNFNLIDHDEAPVLDDSRFAYVASPGQAKRVRYLRPDERISLNIGAIFKDPERAGVSLPDAQLEYCDTGVAGDFVEANGTCVLGTNLPTMPRVLTVTNRGSVLSLVANGSNLTSAGVYWAKLYFGASDQSTPPNVVNARTPGSANITVFVKRGANNAPQFAGGAQGFTASIAEVEENDKMPSLIAPTPADAWNAADLDTANSISRDMLNYQLIGERPMCNETVRNAVQIGQMCIKVVQPTMAAPNVALRAYFVDFESDALSPSKSMTVRLRASDGWDDVDVPIEITVEDINELYARYDPASGRKFPTSVRVIEGESLSFDLNRYFTDPEMQEITYTAYSTNDELWTLSDSSTLMIHGVGTSESMPNFNASVNIEATDGMKTLTRTIQVFVRNSNTPPRFLPANATKFTASIDENVAEGTAVSHLVQFEDADSEAEEITVTVSDPQFRAVVEPLWDGSNVCAPASDTCTQQMNRIAIVTTSQIDYERQQVHEIELSLHDGWAGTTPNHNVILEVKVTDLNEPPEGVGKVPDQTVSVQSSVMIDASEYFVEPDQNQNGRFIVAAASSRTDIATVDVSGASDVTISGVAVGTSTITLTASDLSQSQLQATQTFDVTVVANQPPVADLEAFKKALPPNLEILNSGEVNVPLKDLYSDPDGDVITIEVESTNTQIFFALVEGSGDDATVALLPRNLGSADLVFTATDSAGNVVTNTFTIKVVEQLAADNRPPAVDLDALKSKLTADGPLTVNDFVEIDLSMYFSDPDGDALTFMAISSNSDVITPTIQTDESNLFLFADGIGTATLTITATDPMGEAITVEIMLEVVDATTSPTNQAPVLDQTAFNEALPAEKRMLERKAHRVRYMGLFSDPDGDALTYSIASSDTAVLRVRSSSDGTSAFLLARTVGSANVTVTATDTADNATSAMATIEVVPRTTPPSNRPPVVDREALAAALPANNTMEENDFIEIDLSTIFSDPDAGDRVAAYVASSSNADILDASVQSETTLEVLALNTGTATLNVAATDTRGAETSIEESITVVEAASSVVAGPLQTMDRSAPLTLDARDWIADAAAEDEELTLQLFVRDDTIVQAIADGSELRVHALALGQTLVKMKIATASGYSANRFFFVQVVNAAPTLVAALPDQTMTRVTDLQIDLEGAFVDADGDTFEVSVRAADPNVVALEQTGQSLSLKGLQVGTTAIIVTAVDSGGRMTETSFTLAVENLTPTVSAEAGPINLQVGGSSFHLDYDAVFADDDPLTYATTLNGPRVVETTATLTGQTFTPLKRGQAELTITATDPHGDVASLTTQVVVGDEKLRAAATNALAGFGRAALGSVTEAIDARATLTRNSSDLSSAGDGRGYANSWQSGDSYPGSLARPIHSSSAAEGAGDSVWSRHTADYAYRDPAIADPYMLLGQGFTAKLGNAESTSPWLLWSNMDRQTYGGADYDGSALNAYIGVDKELTDRWLIGMSLSRHRGNARFVYGDAARQLDINTNQLTPYFRYGDAQRSAVWGAMGFGFGNLVTDLDEAEGASHRLRSQIAMLGGRHAVGQHARFDLALRGDAAASQLAVAADAASAPGLSATVHRVRSGLEASYSIDWLGDFSVTPSARLSLRADGGDGDVSPGVELAGGLKLVHRALLIEFSGHAFESGDQQRYSESGIAVTATLNPSRDGTGFSASISPRWGANSYGGDRIWQNITTQSTYAFNPKSADGFTVDGQRQLDAQLGYGIAVANERFVITPFVQHGQNAGSYSESQIGTELAQLVRATSRLSSRLSFGRMHRLAGESTTTFRLSMRMSF